jgi:stage II sporulation protein P
MRRYLPVIMIIGVLAGGVIAIRSGYVPAAIMLRPDERTDGSYFSIVDESGAVLHSTGHALEPGDDWVTADNRRFQITRVEGDIAFTRFVGLYSLAPVEPTGLSRIVDRLFGPSAAPKTGGGGTIAIYHTHSDESYVPTDGTDSKPDKGGIYEVGRALKDALVQKGARVVQDLTSHQPHDGAAYQRSRRTVTALLQQRPSAVFDVHRDAAPPESYEKQVKGQMVTQVVAVLGKGNPKWAANQSFVNALKAEVDRTSPGLMKGVLLRGGDFNQDLYDRIALLEVGAHTNDRKEAERAMGLISASVARVAGVTGGPGPTTPSTGTESRGAWSALRWVIGLTILGIVVYMFVSTGSLKEAMAKLQRFGREDLAGFLGWSRRRSGGAARSRQKPAGGRPQGTPQDHKDSDGQKGPREE